MLPTSVPSWPLPDAIKPLPADSYRHKGMRRRLLAMLKARGILDSEVLAAFDTLPRHYFLDKAFEELAYQDRALPIGAQQTISQPFTVAYQSALLMPLAGRKVLEIGTGSGYQAAILALLGAQVYTLERQETLCHKADKLLSSLGFGSRISVHHSDGFAGLPAQMPFDRILVTAAAPHVPPALLEQLAPQGLLVLPLGVAGPCRMCRFEKRGDTFHRETFADFRFVPMLGGLSG